MCLGHTGSEEQTYIIPQGFIAGVFRTEIPENTGWYAVCTICKAVDCFRYAGQFGNSVTVVVLHLELGGGGLLGSNDDGTGTRLTAIKGSCFRTFQYCYRGNIVGVDICNPVLVVTVPVGPV